MDYSLRNNLIKIAELSPNSEVVNIGGSQMPGNFAARECISKLTSGERKCLHEILHPPQNKPLKYAQWKGSLATKLNAIETGTYANKNYSLSARIARSIKTTIGVRLSTKTLLAEITKEAPRLKLEKGTADAMQEAQAKALEAEELKTMEKRFNKQKANISEEDFYKQKAKNEAAPYYAEEIDLSHEYSLLGIDKDTSASEISKACIQKCEEPPGDFNLHVKFIRAENALITFYFVKQTLFADSTKGNSLKTAHETYELAKTTSDTEELQRLRDDIVKLSVLLHAKHK